MEVMEVFDYAAAAHFMDNVVVGNNFRDVGAPVEKTFETWKALIDELRSFLRRTNQLSPSLESLLPLLSGTPSESFEMLPMALRVDQVYTEIKMPIHAVIFVRMGDLIGICNSGFGLNMYHTPDARGEKISVFFGIHTPSASELWAKIKSLYERVSHNLPIDVVYMLIMSHKGTPFVPTDGYFSKDQKRGTCAFRSYLAFMRFVALNSNLTIQQYKQLALNLRTCHFKQIIDKVTTGGTSPWPRYYVSSIDRLCFQLAGQAEKLPKIEDKPGPFAELAFEEIERARTEIESRAIREDFPVHWNTTKMPSSNSLVGFFDHLTKYYNELSWQNAMLLEYMNMFYKKPNHKSFSVVMLQTKQTTNIIYELILSFWLKNANDYDNEIYVYDDLRFRAPIFTWPQTFEAVNLKLSLIKGHLSSLKAPLKDFFENMIANLNSLRMNPQRMLRLLCGIETHINPSILVQTYFVEQHIYNKTKVMITEIDKHNKKMIKYIKTLNPQTTGLDDLKISFLKRSIGEDVESQTIAKITASILRLYSFKNTDNFYLDFLKSKIITGIDHTFTKDLEETFTETPDYGYVFTIHFERLARLVEEGWEAAKLDRWFENAVENFINFPTTQSHAVYNKWNQFLIMVPAYLKSEVGGIKHSVAPYNLTLDKLAPKIRQLIELRDSPSNIFELLFALRPLASEFVQWDQALLSQVSDYAQQPFAAEDFIDELIEEMPPPSPTCTRYDIDETQETRPYPQEI